MSSLLMLVDTCEGYCIAFCVDGEEGLRIGEEDRSSDLEVRAATDAVKLVWKTTADELFRPVGGEYIFFSKKTATNAIRTARAALRNIKRPLPSWAIEALAAGWKQPKGWKP